MLLPLQRQTRIPLFVSKFGAADFAGDHVLPEAAGRSRDALPLRDDRGGGQSRG